MSAYSIVLLTVAVFVVATKSADTNVKLSDHLVDTNNGPVQGIVQQSRNPSVEYVSFLGLRYSKRPARFEPAGPLDKKWTKPKVAKSPGKICLAVGMDGGSDDCLFLNVHVPSSVLEKESAEPLPVMFWIHGGGFTFGEGHTYGGEYLMENENVILVTVNYRLGVMGFIATEDSTFTANNGLRDLVVALKWVQDNIAAFKGDLGKVTIFGESAGSAAVHYLLMSPLTKGLYHRAIMQSGAFSFWSYAENPKQDAVNFAKALECPNTEDSKAIRTCLEGKSADDLMIGQLSFSPRWPPTNPITRFLPTGKETGDNKFFAGEPSAFFTSHGGKTEYPNKVPVIVGITRDEGALLFTGFVVAIKGQLGKLNKNWNELAPKTFMYDSFLPEESHALVSEKIRKFYFGDAPLKKADNLDILVKVYTDALMMLPVYEAAEDMAKSGLTVWPFMFSYFGEHSPADKFKMSRGPGWVGHADDIQYFFNHPLFAFPLTHESEDEIFSKRLVKLWTGFAKTGVPDASLLNGESLDWKQLSVENLSSNPVDTDWDILELDKESKMISLKFHDRLEFWRQTLNEAKTGESSKGKTEL